MIGLKSKIGQLIPSEFAKNVLTLFTGTTIAQIIPFLVSPLLTRIYSPDDFGLLALFISAYSIIGIIATLQYEAAIILPKDDIDAINLVGLCLRLTIFFSIASLIIVLVLNRQIIQLFGDIRLSIWLYFVPIPVFLLGLYNTLNYWGSRKKKYKRLAARTVSQSATTAGVKLIAGLSGYTNSGLIIGTIFGQTTSTGVLTWFTWKEDKNLLKKITRHGIIKNAKKYKDFPKYGAWQGFFDVLNTSSTNIIISSFFSSSVLGLYSFTVGLLQKPLKLIGNSVGQVYYQKATEIYNNGGNLWNISKKIILRLSLVALIIFIPIVLYGPILFEWIFGKEWRVAGEYARLLVPWIGIRFITSPLAIIANIVGKQKGLFLFVLIYNFIFPIFFLFLIYMGSSFNLSLLVISLFACLYYSAIMYWIKVISNYNK